MKHLILVALLALLSSQALGANYVYDQTFPNNHEWVTENLMRMADQAEEARMARFFKTLKCWTEDQGGHKKVVCEEGSQKLQYVDPPKIEFSKQEPVIMRLWVCDKSGCNWQ